jgi:hypothetical protein
MGQATTLEMGPGTGLDKIVERLANRRLGSFSTDFNEAYLSAGVRFTPESGHPATRK